MRAEVIKADTIDVAVEGILSELNTSRQNIIYFDGWDGLGASAVMRAVAQRLKLKEPARPPGLEFEHVIHVDCSKWESTRAVQREIAKQLKLPNRIMEMFDKQDEEDDFNGVTDQGSRTEMEDVAVEIQRRTQGRRFLLVLHNGSNEEIDLSSLGLSVFRYMTNKVVWTFQGRFRINSKMRDKVMKKNTTDVLLSASRSKRDLQELWSYLLREEATQVACKHGIDPSIAVECFQYIFTLNYIHGHHADTVYDLAKHTCNYWVCDGIIQEASDIDEAWQVGDALQGEMRLDKDNHLKELPFDLVRHAAESIPHWSSPANGFLVVPAGVIPKGMFQHFDKLCVLKLSRCAFSFSSPPFLCCHILRFLWLDHCQDLRSSDAEKKEEDENTTGLWACFQSLWVLDVRYTDWDQILSAQIMDLMTHVRELNVMGAKNWDMSHLRGRLRNIRKLRVTKSTCCFNNDVFLEMESLELLDFSGSTIRQGMTILSGAASNRSLETVIIDGCDGLNVISLSGCKEMKNLLLKGIFHRLEELDLSGTKVKTLNLREVESSTLPKRIILLGCEELHAILWPQKVEEEGWKGLLHVDTTSMSASADGGEAPHAHAYGDRSLQLQKEEIFKGGWQIFLADTRLLRSLSPVASYLRNAPIHIDVSSAAAVGGSNVQGTSSDKLMQVLPHTSAIMDSKYRDVLKHVPVAAMMMRDCPEIFIGNWTTLVTCIIKVIMHGGLGNKLLEDASRACTSALLLPEIICDQATSLHMYNNSSITSIPVPPNGSGWNWLIWCRVERCPKFHTVFTIPQGSSVNSFSRLETFWASQLLMTCYIWDWTSFLTSHSFSCLKFLHLDYCPRLIHVLPIHASSLSVLERLEIVYCGDLREVFPLSPELQEQDAIIEFPKLRRIHLHEVPTLQHICGRKMSAPKLETIKIRGCWSLRRLPAIACDSKPPKVDCEKDWWDNLEWDGVEKCHHRSLYEPTHSKYYKAKLPRGSLLR